MKRLDEQRVFDTPLDQLTVTERDELFDRAMRGNGVAIARSFVELHATTWRPGTLPRTHAPWSDAELAHAVSDFAADALGALTVAHGDDRVSVPEFEAWDELAEDLEMVLEHVLEMGGAL